MPNLAARETSMRRSARLINQFGPLKRKAQERTEAGKSTERISDTPPRSRGLLQDVPAAEDEIIISDYRVVAEPSGNRAHPPSPFLLIERFSEGQILSQPPFPDENTPPRKRRHTTRIDEDAEATIGVDEDGARPDEMEGRGLDNGDKQASHPTWFTPIRSSRTINQQRVLESENGHPSFARTSSPTWPARMPSFAQWIDGSEMAEEQLAGMNFAYNKQDSVADVGTGGVDMTELAVLYDPQTAATAMKSPLSPIEKICQRATISESSEDEME